MKCPLRVLAIVVIHIWSGNTSCAKSQCWSLRSFHVCGIDTRTSTNIDDRLTLTYSFIHPSAPFAPSLCRTCSNIHVVHVFLMYPSRTSAALAHPHRFYAHLSHFCGGCLVAKPNPQTPQRETHFAHLSHFCGGCLFGF